MAQRVDSCPPALRDLRDVLVAALVAKLLQPAPAAPRGPAAPVPANDPDQAGAA